MPSLEIIWMDGIAAWLSIWGLLLARPRLSGLRPQPLTLLDGEPLP